MTTVLSIFGLCYLFAWCFVGLYLGFKHESHREALESSAKKGNLADTAKNILGILLIVGTILASKIKQTKAEPKNKKETKELCAYSRGCSSCS